MALTALRRTEEMSGLVYIAVAAFLSVSNLELVWYLKNIQLFNMFQTSIINSSHLADIASLVSARTTSSF